MITSQQGTACVWTRPGELYPGVRWKGNGWGLIWRKMGKLSSLFIRHTNNKADVGVSKHTTIEQKEEVIYLLIQLDACQWTRILGLFGFGPRLDRHSCCRYGNRIPTETFQDSVLRFSFDKQHKQRIGQRLRNSKGKKCRIMLCLRTQFQKVEFRVGHMAEGQTMI